MALTGSFTLYTPSETEYDIFSSSITYPSDISAYSGSGDPMYQFAGQTIEQITSQSKMVPSETIEGAYCNIKSLSVYSTDLKTAAGVEKENKIFMHYKVYTSSIARYDDPENPHYEEMIDSVPITFSADINYHTEAYNYISGLLGFESMSNDEN